MEDGGDDVEIAGILRGDRTEEQCVSLYDDHHWRERDQSYRLITIISIAITIIIINGGSHLHLYIVSQTESLTHTRTHTHTAPPSLYTTECHMHGAKWREQSCTTTAVVADGDWGCFSAVVVEGEREREVV